MEVRILFTALILAAGIPPTRAHAERLSLDTLIAEAEQKNPEILAAEKRYEAALQRPKQESSLPDLLFSPGYTSNANPWPFAGLGTWQTSHVGAMVSQEIPFPGKRRLRGDIATKESEGELQEYQVVKLRVMARLKEAFYQLHYAYVATEILRRNRELLQKLRRRIDTPFFTGQAAQQAQLSVLETRILKMEQEKRSLEGEINSLLTRDPDSLLARPAEPATVKLSLTLEELSAHARQKAPALLREQKMIERGELAVNLARKEYFPDYTISAGYFNMGRMPDMYQFRIDLRLPAYFWRKQRPGVAEQVYSLTRAQRSYEAAERGLAFRLRNEYLRAETSTRVMKTYADVVIPQAQAALESYMAAYEAGAVDFVAVQMTFLAALEAELSYQEERLNFYRAVIRLEELTGLSLLS